MYDPRGKTDRHCSNPTCNQDLRIGIAPKSEDIVVHCRRCKTFNVVRYGVATRIATIDEIAAANAERATARLAV